MRCPECGQANIAGALFCEACGADLSHVAAPPPPEPAVPTLATVAAPAEPPESADPPRVCADCGHPNEATFLVCESCGRVLDAPAPEPEPDPAPVRHIETPDSPPPPPASASSAEKPTQAVGGTPGQLVTGPVRGKVKLVVEQGMVLGKQFLLTGERMLVGREDAGDQLFPEIDLTGLDEGFVHRRHAQLTFEGSFLFVTHLGGHNRTYVNNRPIADQLPHPLNIGDTVRFGKVLMRVVEA
jgi:hypothetical protein